MGVVRVERDDAVAAVDEHGLLIGNTGAGGAAPPIYGAHGIAHVLKEVHPLTTQLEAARLGAEDREGDTHDHREYHHGQHELDQGETRPVARAARHGLATTVVTSIGAPMVGSI